MSTPNFVKQMPWWARANSSTNPRRNRPNLPGWAHFVPIEAHENAEHDEPRRVEWLTADEPDEAA